MNTADQIAAMDAWLDAHPPLVNDPNATPRVVEDVDTLRRSRYAVAAAEPIRRRMDLPSEPWMDELGVVTGDRRAAS